MVTQREREKYPRKRMVMLLINPKYEDTCFIQVRSCFKRYKIYDTLVKIWDKYRISQNPDFYYNFYDFYDGSLLKFKRENLIIDEEADKLGDTYHEIIHKYKKILREKGYTKILTIKKQKI